MAGLQIVIVENHADTLKWLAAYVRQLGHEVRTAMTMESALQELAQGTPDVLISDIGLPDGDGWELMKKAGLPSSVYAIAMSGFGANADHSKSSAAGFRRHVLKPFGPDVLDRCLDEAMNEKAAYC